MPRPRWILFSLGLLLSLAGQAQICVPAEWLFDRQLVADDGGLLLLQTQVGPYYMLYAYGSSDLKLRVLHLGPDGKTRHDSVRTLLWPEWKHHYTWQPDTALGRSRPLLLPDTAGGPHEGYLSHLARRDIYSNYHGNWAAARRRDPLKLVWDPAIATTGKRRATRWLAREVGSPARFPAGFERNPYPRRLLDRQLPYLRPAAPTFSQDQAGCIRLLGEAAYLQAAASASSPANDSSPPASWLVQGPGWQVALDGYVDPTAPLVSLAPGRRLYVTVVHEEPRQCPPFRDTWPIVYCLDLQRGVVLWQRQPPNLYPSR